MELQVFDTYIKGANGEMHIDILMPKPKKSKHALVAGKEFLNSIGEENAELTSCRFCHVIQGTPEQIKDVEKQGYYILEL